MGVAASVLIPTCVVSTSCFIITSHACVLLGCILPVTCEVIHVVTDNALRSEGKLSIDDDIAAVSHWRIVQFGIRSYSLNCCGRWNHVLDILRRILAPWSSSFSGAMVHDILVAGIQDPDSNEELFVILGKAHNGDLSVEICQNIDEVDMKGKPTVFGQPKNGWWKLNAKEPFVALTDILDIFSKLPAVYQPVSNNCHHFTKELWNWFAQEMKEKGIKERFIHFPRGRCQPKCRS